MNNALLKLTTWLSPSFPVGAFSYSHGLEYAIHANEITDRETAQAWIGACLCQGTARNDAVLLAHTMRGGDPNELDALARAFAPSRERLLETEAQGAAFGRTVSDTAGTDATQRAYPVALGIAARDNGCPEPETVTLYLQAFVANLVSASIRLIPIGQTDGQRIIAALGPAVIETASEALAATLDDLGGCAICADITSMRHETQTVRIFRT